MASILGNIAGGLVNKTLGKTAGGRTIARLIGAGLPAGGEVGNTLRSSARWTRTEASDYRVKVTLPPNSVLWDPFFGGTKSEVQSKLATDFDESASLGSNNPVLAPLADAGGVVFPISPGIIINHTASYSPLAMPHSNYPHYAYNNSEVPSFTITAEFPVQNAADAKYWVAMLHFFRATTKMFFGGEDTDPLKGNPPPILQLSGYGDHVFKNVPVVVTGFSIDMRSDVDYICTEQNFTKNQMTRELVVDPGINKTWAPTMSTTTTQLQPIYSRDSVKKFNMRDFVNGNLTDVDGVGFI